ncbi:hypothetical protein RB195_024308 [Necator americanus]|uniref:Homeobox domain protein n=1 Tax=Necator americanus TaxID=51031 RepID=A0ABR1ENF7_NECAM
MTSYLIFLAFIIRSSMAASDASDFNRAVESICRKHVQMEMRTKQMIANSFMILQTRIADMRKRRRNFSKEATDILQEYYERHSTHPYPTEDEKAVLAEKCHITVQQVSNWFGNRRIRMKKSQRSQDFCKTGYEFALKTPKLGNLSSMRFPSRLKTEES